MTRPARYTDTPFPSYTFIPGENPHPVRDPQGHSFGKEGPDNIEFREDKWQSCESYLYGIDLFNYEYWWESHEALEGVWIAAGRTSVTGYFIQGLIQVAVAQLKQRQGFTDVARRMAADGLDKMVPVQQSFLGIDPWQFRKDVKRFIEQPDSLPIVINLDMNS